MATKENTKADQHDHNNHLPKDVLNLEQDANSFKDPLEQQLEKQANIEKTVKENDSKKLKNESND